LFDKESFYTSRLRDMQHLLAGGIEALAMQRHDVREAMRSDVVKVRPTAMFDDVMEVFSNARRDTVYVVDEGNALLGRIHIHDVKYFINDPSLKSVVIAADLSQPAQPVWPEQSLASVMSRFDDPDLEELPVIAPGPTPLLLGRLTRRDVIALLSDEVLGQRRLRTKLKVEGQAEASYVELPEGSELARIRVPDAMVGRALDSLDLPGTASLTPMVVIQVDEDGREQRLLPQPNHVLLDGSSLIVLGRPEAIVAFQIET
jgi:CBS domain-containing protein